MKNLLNGRDGVAWSNSIVEDITCRRVARWKGVERLRMLAVLSLGVAGI
jgi:hypothetical protein